MANNVTMIPGNLPALGYAQNTLPAGAQSILGGGGVVGVAAIPDNSKRAIIQAEAVDVRYTDDGSTPTATFGMLLPAGGFLDYATDFSKLKFIRTGAGSILNISFYG